MQLNKAKLNSAAIEDVPLEPFRDYLTWETSLQSGSNGTTSSICAPSGILVV